MRRVSTSRSQHADLLTRPPCTERALEGGWGTLIVDPVGQLEELADLRNRGLLTPEEHERQKDRVLAVWRTT
jgi:Short C-terminal domain